MVEIRDNGPEARAILEKADASTERSVYLPLLRGITPRPLEAFDPVDQTLVTGMRQVTTVPGQALYLLNSPFVRRQALALAARLLDQEATDEDRIRALYRLVLGRSPKRRRRGEEQGVPGGIPDGPGRAGRSRPTPSRESLSPPSRSHAPSRSHHRRTRTRSTRQASRSLSPSFERRDARTEAWLALAQALFGTAEFRYVR